MSRPKGASAIWGGGRAQDVSPDSFPTGPRQHPRLDLKTAKSMGVCGIASRFKSAHGHTPADRGAQGLPWIGMQPQAQQQQRPLAGGSAQSRSSSGNAQPAPARRRRGAPVFGGGLVGPGRGRAAGGIPLFPVGSPALSCVEKEELDTRQSRRGGCGPTHQTGTPELSSVEKSALEAALMEKEKLWRRRKQTALFMVPPLSQGWRHP